MVKIRDLQDRPDQPLVRREQVASNGWSFTILVDYSLLDVMVRCPGCGTEEPLGVILGLWDSGPPHDPILTCWEDGCDHDLLDRVLEEWC